jgi:hypothetical protein
MNLQAKETVKNEKKAPARQGQATLQQIWQQSAAQPKIRPAPGNPGSVQSGGYNMQTNQIRFQGYLSGPVARPPPSEFLPPQVGNWSNEMQADHGGYGYGGHPRGGYGIHFPPQFGWYHQSGYPFAMPNTQVETLIPHGGCLPQQNADQRVQESVLKSLVTLLRCPQLSTCTHLNLWGAASVLQSTI